MPNGSLVGGTKKDLNEAIQAKHAAEHKAAFAAGVRHRCQLCRCREDPFSTKVPRMNKAEEKVQLQRLNGLVLQVIADEISELRAQMRAASKRSMIYLEAYPDEELEADFDDTHRLQVFALEKMVDRLQLPYKEAIQQMKAKYESWRTRQTKILRLFSSRLRRALPYCLTCDADYNYIESIDERIKFEDDLKTYCPEPESYPIELELYDEGLIGVKECLGYNLRYMKHD